MRSRQRDLRSPERLAKARLAKFSMWSDYQLRIGQICKAIKDISSTLIESEGSLAVIDSKLDWVLSTEPYKKLKAAFEWPFDDIEAIVLNTQDQAARDKQLVKRLRTVNVDHVTELYDVLRNDILGKSGLFCAGQTLRKKLFGDKRIWKDLFSAGLPIDAAAERTVLEGHGHRYGLEVDIIEGGAAFL